MIHNASAYALVRAAILDRDGTIIEEANYLRDPNSVRLLPKAAEAIRLLRDAGYIIWVASNQSGVARGLITREEAAKVHERFVQLLRAEGAEPHGVFYCFHGPDEGCGCRKPAAGLLPQKWQGQPVTFQESIVIGDKASDLELAKTIGGKAWLVRTGYGRATERDSERKSPSFFVADDLYSASIALLENT